MKKIQIREFNYKQFFLDNKEIIKLQNGIIYPKIAFLGAVITTFALTAASWEKKKQQKCWQITLSRDSRYYSKQPGNPGLFVFTKVMKKKISYTKILC